MTDNMLRWIAVIIVLLFVYHVREVFPPFIVGGIIAYLLFPLVSVVNKLNRFPLFRWVTPGSAVALIYLLTATVIGILVYKLGPTLAEQINNLFINREQIATSLVQSASDQLHLNLNVPESSKALVKWLEESLENPTGIAHVGGLLSHSLLSILVCIVSSIYFMLDSQRVGRFFLRFVPEERRTTMVNMIGQMNTMLSKYVTGQLILIALMSAVAFCFLQFGFHLKYALLVAILSGCFEIIPVLGPFIAISIAVIVAVSQFGISYVILMIIACYMIARWLEDYWVVPAIIGHAVELHALAVIFAVLVGETMAGPLGMLIAIPVAASFKVVIDTVYPPEHQEPVAHKQGPDLMTRFFSSIYEPPKPSNGANGSTHSSPSDDGGKHGAEEIKSVEMKADSQTIHAPIDPALESVKPKRPESGEEPQAH